MNVCLSALGLDGLWEFDCLLALGLKGLRGLGLKGLWA